MNMKKLVSLILCITMLTGILAMGFAGMTSAAAASTIDENYEQKEDDIIFCTPKFAYDQGADFYKMWWICNKGNYQKLVNEYYAPYHSTVLDNRRDFSYRASEIEWRILTFNLGELNHSNKEKAYVEALLFNLLYDESHGSLATTFGDASTDLISDVQKDIDSYGFELWKKLFEMGATFNEMTPKTDPAFTNNKEAAKMLGGLAEELGLASDVADVLEHVTTVGELITNLAKVKALVGTGNDVSEILTGMKNRMTESNDAYSSTLTNFANYVSDYMTEDLAMKIFTGETAQREFFGDVIQTIWEAVGKKLKSVQAIQLGSSVGKFLSNNLTGIDDQYNKFNELEVYFDIEMLLRLEISWIIDEVNRGNFDAAKLFQPAYGMLKNMYGLNLDCYEEYAAKLYRDGVLNAAMPWINGGKYDNAIRSAESLRESMNGLFASDSVKCANAYKNMKNYYDPDMTESPAEKEMPAGSKDESEYQETFENLKPTFGMGIKKDQTMTRDVEMYGSIHLEDGNFNLNGHELTIWGNLRIDGGTFVGSGVINVKGSVYQTGGTLTLPGACTLNVDGNYELTPGYYGSALNVNGGRLVVGGDIISHDSEYNDSRYYTSFRIDSSGEAEVGGSVRLGVSGNAYLNSGTLRVNGDYCANQLNSTDVNGFTLIAAGTDPVRIQNLQRVTLLIQNPANRSITFADTVSPGSLKGGDMTVIPENLSFGGTLQNDVTFTGPVKVGSATDLNGHSLTIRDSLTVSEYVTVNGSLDVSGSIYHDYGTVTVGAGSTLTVDGNYDLTPGYYGSSLDISGGTAVIGGDVISHDLSFSDSRYYVNLFVNNSGDLEVGGSVSLGTQTNTYLYSGTLTVQGDYCASQPNNTDTGDFTLTAAGTEPVRIQNLKGVTLNIENAADREITFSKTVAPKTLTGGDMTVTPEELIFWGTLDNDLTVNGSMTIANDVYLKNHTLTVNGDIRHTYGVLNTDSGTLDVTGSYKMAYLSNGADGEGYGSIRMTSDDAMVKVGKDLLVWTNQTSTLTKGTLTIGGHFTQKGSGGFTASDKHNTILNGTKLQRITFGNTSNRFNTLWLGQFREQYIFNPDNCWKELKIVCTHEFTEVRDRVDVACLVDGYTGDTYCLVCGELLEQGSVIEAEGHDLYQGPLAATCTEPGYDYIRYCKTCGEVFQSKNEIPALGHDWGAWTVTKAPTATEDGEETRVCSHDSSHTETRTIPATGYVLTITTQPTDYTGAVNSVATFEVHAEGTGLSYQWQYSDNNGGTWKKSSVTNALYSATLTAAKDGRQVRCVVTDAGGNSVTSDAATMRVSKLTITQQPKDYAGKVNSTASFTVAATGEGLSYQWQISDDQGENWTNSSVKTAKYSAKLTAAKDGRLVRCIVSDQSGASVTSASASMSIASSLTITRQPTDYTGKLNSTASFSVAAEGESLSYQWQYSDNGGSTWKKSSVVSAVYSATLTAAKDGRMVRCIVTDQSGNSVTSASAVMRISGFAITTQPKDYVGKVNTTASFTVAADGTGLSYQWQVSDDGKTWSNSSVKAAKYTTRLTAARDGRMVRCIVTDADDNTVTTNAVTMKIG